VSGAISGIFVVFANAWMNAPAGFDVIDGKVANIDPIAAMFNAAAFQQTLHMTLAAYAATGLAVAGVHAIVILRSRADAFHVAAMRVALIVGVPAALVQPLSGHHSAEFIAVRQPVKLAAMEGQFHTERGAPLRIGGIPDEVRESTDYAIEIPRGLSYLAFDDVNAEVKGLDVVPRADRPPVAVVHMAFQVMVGLGTFMALVAAWTIVSWLRRRDIIASRPLLTAIALTAPMGFICVEAGWVVTEVGRQPWIVQGVLRTADAVTPMPGLVVPLVGFTLLYIFLGVIVTWLMYNQIIRTRPRTLMHPVPPMPSPRVGG
jgi:cytochrome d ubiquinol oxidase subunit I